MSKEIKCLQLGLYQSNCYLLINDNEMVIIDPGYQPERIINTIEQYPNVQVQAILLTHGHFDHIGAVDKLFEVYQCPIYVSEFDDMLIHSDKYDVNVNNKIRIKNSTNDYPIGKLKISSFDFLIYDTPGHTEGSVCIQWNDNLFTGDTLFALSVGRTDLFGGCDNKLKQSLNLLKQLDPSLKLYPGHGESSTLQQELLNNRYLQ